MSLEDKVHSLELKLATIEGRNSSTQKWQMIVAGLILAWLGFTSFVQIPGESEKVIRDLQVKDAIKRISQHEELAKSSAAEAASAKSRSTSDADAIKNILIQNSAGTISVNSQCFKPNKLTRCYKSGNHMTWVNNSQECTNHGYKVEGSIWVLSQC